MSHPHRSPFRPGGARLRLYPLVRLCVLCALLATAIGLVYWPSTLLFVVAAAELACVLVVMAARALRRASQRIDTILREETIPARPRHGRHATGHRRVWQKSA